MIKWIKKLFRDERNSKSRNNKSSKRTEANIRERFIWKSKVFKTRRDQYKGQLEIVYKPSYEPLPRRYSFRKRRLEDLSKAVKIHKGKDTTIFNDLSSLTVSSVYSKDVLSLEGSQTFIPKAVQDKVRARNIIITDKKYKEFCFHNHWSVTKLLWECFKESQYVEFEE